MFRFDSSHLITNAPVYHFIRVTLRRIRPIITFFRSKSHSIFLMKTEFLRYSRLMNSESEKILKS
ncbi:hypothetical protein CH375_03975 [Leptospira ellisii]|nr:hypothetical protein CH375_03975 [Leptospira ellisii]